MLLNEIANAATETTVGNHQCFSAKQINQLSIPSRKSAPFVFG